MAGPVDEASCSAASSTSNGADGDRMVPRAPGCATAAAATVSSAPSGMSGMVRSDSPVRKGIGKRQKERASSSVPRFSYSTISTATCEFRIIKFMTRLASSNTTRPSSLSTTDDRNDCRLPTDTMIDSCDSRSSATPRSSNTSTSSSRSVSELESPYWNADPDFTRASSMASTQSRRSIALLQQQRKPPNRDRTSKQFDRSRRYAYTDTPRSRCATHTLCPPASNMAVVPRHLSSWNDLGRPSCIECLPPIPCRPALPPPAKSAAADTDGDDDGAAAPLKSAPKLPASPPVAPCNRGSHRRSAPSSPTVQTCDSTRVASTTSVLWPRRRKSCNVGVAVLHTLTFESVDVVHRVWPMATTDVMLSECAIHITT